jgi:hypothetical protein
MYCAVSLAFQAAMLLKAWLDENQEIHKGMLILFSFILIVAEL